METFFRTVTPEQAGVSSENVLRFINALERASIHLHSILLLKGNDIFAEAYRPPFQKDELHRMYSVSKSFVSMSIGLLVGEGRVRLDDPIIRFFPEYDTPKLDPYIRAMTIEDMLKMSTAYSYGTTYSAHRPAYEEPDWVSTFFTTETSHPSGTVYNYDTSASYMLDVVVERVTGMPFLEYLKQKALLKLGFSESAYCLKAPEGYSWGGSAVLCTSRDLARLARLVMMKGMYNGEQLLPREYVIAATSRQIDNDQSGFRDGCNGCGYGYQVWMTDDNSFSFIGMGNQLAICMPEEDMLFVCTADTQGSEAARTRIYDFLWRFVKETASASPLPDDPDAQKRLADVLNSLKYPTVHGALHTDTADRIADKTYLLGENPMGIRKLLFHFEQNGDAVMRYTNAQGDKELRFGFGKAVIGEFPQDGYFGDTIGKDGKKRYRCIASGAWTDEKSMRIKADLIDRYFGNLNILIGFKGDEIGLFMEKHAEWFLNEYNGFAGGRMA